MEEVWKHINEEGLEDYVVSNTGRVKLLARDVPTRIVNRGRDMIVTAHRKEKELVPSYEYNRPIIRMRKPDGTRVKRSLPLLVLTTFDPKPEYSNHNVYTAAYLDGDFTNNNLENLIYVTKASLMASIGHTTKGEDKPWLKKYERCLIKVNDSLVGYFSDTNEAAEIFNRYGFHTSASAISRALHDKTKFYYMFDFIPVDEEEYDLVSKRNQIVDLKVIYDIVLEERRHQKKPVYKNVVKTETVYKDKIKQVYVHDLPKDVKVKLKTTKKSFTSVSEAVNIRSRDEKTKKEIKEQCDNILSNREESKKQEVKTTKAKNEEHKSVHDIKQDIFKRELLKRLGDK